MEVLIKKCSMCGEEKSLDCFRANSRSKDGKRPECKTCKSNIEKEYRKNNLEKLRDKDHQYYLKNSERIKEYSKEYYQINIERHKEKSKEWYLANQDKVKESRQRYIDKDPEAVKKYMNEYMKNRYATDINYKIKSIINKRLRDGLRSTKNFPTIDYLGCSIEHFKAWMEYQFDDNMSWENLGSYWHIDHVKPCSSYNFNSHSQIFECYNWSNLRPLEKTENIRKSNKVIPDLIRIHSDLVNRFKIHTNWCTKVDAKASTGEE